MKRQLFRFHQNSSWVIPYCIALWATLVPASARAADILNLNNPIGSNDQSFLFLVVNIMQLLLGGVAVLGLVMVIWGGFMILTSAGKEERITKGKDTLLYAVIGLAIMLLSGVIMRAIISGIDPNTVFGHT